MIKMELTAILYSKKNYDLAYKVHNICKEFSINLITALDFVELTIKSLELEPQIIFCDCETIDFSSSILNAFLEKQEYKTKKIIFLGDERSTAGLKSIVCKNLMISKISELSSIITDMQSELNFESISTRLKDEAYKNLDIEISKLLVDLGFSMKYSGCAYLKLGIKNVIANKGILHSLSSNEYPIIAANFKTTSANVERNIRNAIEKAWKGFGKNYWHKVFYSKCLEDGKKPTNREFIYMCIENLMPQFEKRKIGNYN